MTGKHFQPFIPSAKVKRAIVGKTDEAITKFIKSFGIDLIQSAENTELDKPIRNHADLSIIRVGEEIFFSDSKQKDIFNNFIPHSNLIETKVKSPYPNDCRLNAAVIGEYVFAKMSSLDERLCDYFKENGYHLVNVNQGYANCSTCIIDENHLITDDPSIFKAANKHSINSLLIEKGDIKLDGYGYGFIGGASALIDKNHLIFFGDITKHRSFSEIDDFLASINCKYDYFHDYSLTDIGGIIFL